MLLLPVLFVLVPLSVAQNFCSVQGKYVDEFPNAINVNNEEVSGLTLNAAGSHFFQISDSPESNPLIFVTRHTQTPSVAATIKITGVQNNNFNGGYGDWESLVTFPCSSDPSRQCIVIGDIGHNKVRNKGGVLRSSSQSVRFIEVEEPDTNALNSGQVLERPGKEYAFSYPAGNRFDAEAMVVKDNRLFVITKNSGEYQYSHMFEVPKMEDGVELIERAIFQVKHSEVTGATSSPGYLILRTYIGLNFYKWDDMCDDSVRESKVYQTIPYLERNHGLQEAIAYDASNRYLYLAGERKSSLYRMPCTPAASPTRSPAFSSACLDDFGGKASLASTASYACRLDSCSLLTLVIAMLAQWFC